MKKDINDVLKEINDIIERDTGRKNEELSEEDKHLKAMFDIMNDGYLEMRTKVGKYITDNCPTMNPYKMVISFLKVTLQIEEENYEKAVKSYGEIISKIIGNSENVDELSEGLESLTDFLREKASK